MEDEGDDGDDEMGTLDPPAADTRLLASDESAEPCDIPGRYIDPGAPVLL
jgi:hypothetical protein